MNTIKLVIWDLDETFWSGTLSEEGISVIKQNVDIVKVLTNRGIINSIVSKNDFDQVKAKLEEIGVWDFFVFPFIDWQPKGPAIKSLIELCQLRDENVLFIDDNHLNLEEAKFFNPTINTAFPDILRNLLAEPSLQGKNDLTHSRLSQYKLLETKQQESLKFKSNTDFLYASKIVVSFITGAALIKHIDRIVEIIDRTNQLNFTKLRSTRAELLDILSNANFKVGLINVRDRYGDYGIVGFYALNIIEHSLLHFTFSCRILNLSVPQYIYAILGYPSINIISDVVESLRLNNKPDWISEADIEVVAPVNKSKLKKKIFFKGGCDLSQMLFYLQGSNFQIIDEINYMSSINFPIHNDNTQVILDSINLESERKAYITESEFILFTDSKYYDTKILNGEYDCVLISLLMDYTQDLYVHNDLNVKIPVGGYSSHWTDVSAHSVMKTNFKEKKIVFKEHDLLEFSNNFKYLGQISPEDFKDNLREIRKKVNESIPIIFLNGCEVPSPLLSENSALGRHMLMNSALEEFINASTNTYLLDVRKSVYRADHLTTNIRHYQRAVYQNISEELLKVLNSIFGNEVATTIPLSVKLKDKFRHIVKPKIKSLLNLIRG